MNKYLFSEPRKYDALRNGIYRCYFNEEVTNQEISHETEGGETITEVIVNYGYNAVDVRSLDYGEIVNAIIRNGQRTVEEEGEIRVVGPFSQSEAEAIIRHKLAGEPCAFDDFNSFAEWAKGEAARILSE